MNRRRRIRIALAFYLSAGAFVMQLGGCFAITANTGVASYSQNLIDANGNFLGIFPVCGIPATAVQNEDGTFGPILNGDDDLMFGCPTTAVIVGG